MLNNFPLRTVSAPTPLSYGVQPGTVDILCIARGGAQLAGDVLQQDSHGIQIAADGLTATAGEASLGLNTSVWSSVAAPTNGAGASGLALDTGIVVKASPQPFFGVALRAAADLADIPIRLYGMVTAFVIAATGTTVAGGGWIPTVAKNADAVTTAPEWGRVLGFIQHAGTTPTTRTLGEIFINGLGGLGLGFFSAAT